MDYTIQKNLLQGLQKGETAAFDHLHKTSYKVIASLSDSITGRKEDAEDLYYEGIAALLHDINKPNFVLKGKVRTLLFKICRNKNIDKLKSEKSKMNYMNEQRNYSYEETFEESIDRKVFQGIYWKSFKKMKEDCQTLMKMALENVPMAVIAQKMGLTTGSIKNKKKNCLIALYNIIKAHPEYAQMVKNGEIEPD